MQNNMVIDSAISLEHISDIFAILSKVPQFVEKNPACPQ